MIRYGTLLIALAAGNCGCAQEPPLMVPGVLYFDAGPQGSALDDRSVALIPDSRYSSQVGFGWTQPPDHAFIRGDLAQSRRALTIDGVIGRRLGFQANVASGDWFVTCWLEVAGNKESWPKVVVQGQPHRLNWQQFRPPAEPRSSPQNVYRVFQCVATVGTAGLTLELLGEQDDVRLLGVSLIRRTANPTSAQSEFLQRLQRTADYPSHFSSGDLLELVKALPKTDSREAEFPSDNSENDPFGAFWRQRLELMALAERYYALRGWQSARQETGLGMFDRQHQAVMLLDGLLMPDVDKFPLAERATFLRGQLLYWLGRQNGGVHETAGGRRDLESLARRHPDDQLLAMYTGQRIDLPDPCDCLTPLVTAPEWSVAQREALCRLRLIAHWWVEQRQSETGEFGGKFGDDVELLRWWAPLCLAGDQTALLGWQRLADGVWRSEHLFAGYARELADVEHAAEFLADTAPLMAIYRDEPRFTQRLRDSARHFESLWTGITPQGNRFFRSAWFSSTEIATDEPKSRDVEYNTRAVQACAIWPAGIRKNIWLRCYTNGQRPGHARRCAPTKASPRG